MSKNILFITIFLKCLCVSAQNDSLPTFITDSLDTYIERGMKDWQIPGISVAIVKGDSVIYLKGFGVTSIEGSEPVDENTLFMIGSNTKAFTATMLSMLEESTDFQLTDKVHKWMPEFHLKDSLANREVNTVDLLSHRIGFEAFQGDLASYASTLTRAEVIQKMGLLEAPHSFRTKYGYCNAAYVVAGELIPKIINRSWEETVRDSILLPLQMNRTLMLAEEMESATNTAKPHTLIANDLIEIPFAKLDNLGPAGSMSSSAKDMTRWLFAQLNDGQINDKQVISAKGIQTIRTPSNIVGVDPGINRETRFYLYGMGLSISHRNNKLVYYHGGGLDGFRSSVFFVPEDKIGIVVLTNTDQNNFNTALSTEILESFLELPYKNFSEKSLESFRQNKFAETSKLDSLRKVIELKNKTSLTLNEYTGTYENEIYGTIELKLENDGLNIYFSNHPRLVGKLEHLKNDNFLCTYSIPIFGTTEIPFQIENNKVSGLELKAEGIESTPYQFRKTD